MKTICRYALLSFLLAALLLAQCPMAAFAADTYPEIWHLEGGVPDENGAWIHEYWVDSDGNRMKETPMRKSLRAPADLPRSYDLRDYDAVTPVKFQAGAESCWAFGPVASLESNYILQGYGTKENTDFSEAHLVWFAQHQRTPDTSDPTYGDGKEVSLPYRTGGNWTMAASALMRGSGLELEQNAPWITTYDYDRLMQMAQPESARYVSYARMWSARKIEDESAQTFKQLIMQNGAATLSYYDNYSDYQRGTISESGYSSDKKCYFQTAQTSSNHTVTVVGWNDDFPSSDFNPSQQPSGNGAWLIKGSYGSTWGESGYYWISYEDASLGEFVSYVAAPADVYDHIYQYDGSNPTLRLTVSNSAKMANVFTAERDELLTHAAFFSPNETSVRATVEVYTAPDGFQYGGKNPITGMQKVSDATTTVSAVEYGYTTVELQTPVSLTAGEKFTLVVTFTKSGGSVMIPVEGYSVNNPAEGITTYAGNVGDSFFGYGTAWYDTNAYNHTSGVLDMNNVPLKAMTRDLETPGPTLTLQSAPDKTTYKVGDTLDTTGLSLLYTDEYGDALVVTDGFTCDPTILSAIGTQTVTVTYNDLSVSFDVTVEAYEPTLTLQSAPDKTTYKVGDTLDTTGLSLLYTDEYGDALVVTDGFTCDPTILSAIGTQSVTVTYHEFSVSFDVTVEAYEPTLTLQSAPDKTTYKVGDTLDTTGLALLYTDEYGDALVVTDGFTCDPTILSAIGTQTVTVTYNELSVSFDVTVEAYEPTLTLQSAPDKTTYKVGDTLDTTGLSLLYTDEYGDALVVTDGFTCDPTTLSAIGTQTVTVTYNELSVSFDVTVEAYEPTLTLQSAPDKTTYKVGDTLDTTGLSLLYTDEYGDALVVTDGFTCDPTTLSAIGTQTVTVTYNELSVSFDVTVEQPGLFLAADAQARAGETVDVAVRISANPGLVSTLLELNYDTQVLEMVGVRNGSVFPLGSFTAGNDLTAVPFRVLFVDALTHTDYTQDDELVVFTFRVRADAPAGETTIRLTHKENSTCNAAMQSVLFETQDGTFTVTRLPGDVNADGSVDMKDVILLRRYLAGWDVTINLSNADVDGESDVDVRDVVYITRFLAGGYGLILH